MSIKKGISIIAKSTVMLDDATVFANNTADILPWPVSRLYTEVCLKKEDRAIDGEKSPMPWGFHSTRLSSFAMLFWASEMLAVTLN